MSPAELRNELARVDRALAQRSLPINTIVPLSIITGATLMAGLMLLLRFG